MNQRQIVEAMFKVLADRSLLLLTLVLNFSLFAYAVAYPDYIRFATAGLFSLSVFCPTLKYRGASTPDTTQEREAA